jgi:hypothetical protein
LVCFVSGALGVYGHVPRVTRKLWCLYCVFDTPLQGQYTQWRWPAPGADPFGHIRRILLPCWHWGSSISVVLGGRSVRWQMTLFRRVGVACERQRIGALQLQPDLRTTRLLLAALVRTPHVEAGRNIGITLCGGTCLSSVGFDGRGALGGVAWLIFVPGVPLSRASSNACC